MTDIRQTTQVRRAVPCPLVLVAAGIGVIVFGFRHTITAVLLHPSVPAPVILWAHVALASTWLGGLLAQALLAAAGRVDLHRRLGGLGAAVGAMMSVVAFFTAIELRKLDTVGDPIANIASPGRAIAACRA